MTEAELQRLADLVADRLAERLAGNLAPSPRLVGVRELADALGVSTTYVYEHAAELGGLKLSQGGKRPTLRFDLLAAVEALRHGSSEPEAPAPAPRRRSRRTTTRRSGSRVELLPIRGKEPRA